MNKIFTIIDKQLIAKDTFKMTLSGNTLDILEPGQFINIKIGEGLDHFLRRPISISEYNHDSLTIIFKTLGKGTIRLSESKINTTLDVLSPLGNGFKIKSNHKKNLLIGGGIGVPPLYELAKQLKQKNIVFDVILGFNSIEDCFYEEEFKAYANNVFVTTIDGSYGFKGNPIELIKQNHIHFDYYYACGPEKMLEALIKEKYNGQLSFEERMGCGFGACMGCSKKTIQGYKRICKEGPVLESKEVYIDE